MTLSDGDESDEIPCLVEVSSDERTEPDLDHPGLSQTGVMQGSAITQAQAGGEPPQTVHRDLTDGLAATGTEVEPRATSNNATAELERTQTALCADAERSPAARAASGIVGEVRRTPDPSGTNIDQLIHTMANIENGMAAIVAAGGASSEQHHVASVFAQVRQSLHAVVQDYTLLTPDEAGRLGGFVVDLRDHLEAALNMVHTDTVRSILLATVCVPRRSGTQGGEHQPTTSWYDAAASTAVGPAIATPVDDNHGRSVFHQLRAWMHN